MRAISTEPGEVRAGTRWFDEFQTSELPRLRLAFTSAFGGEVGSEVTADAVSYAWEHRDRLAGMERPAGYLFRVGQSAARRHLRWRRAPEAMSIVPAYEDRIDPDLPAALRRLTDRQRVAVCLVHVSGWTYEESADAMGVDVSTVRTHVSRALERLRRILGEEDR